MAYKILYIDDLETASREKDIEGLGFEVKLYNPTSDLTDLFNALEPNTSASILDYRLTKGENHACFDAPTIAQTLRTKHKEDLQGFPLILMSNESIKVEEFDKDLTSQDLFDFVLTKEEFMRNMDSFKVKLNSFIETYSTIKIEKFELNKILKIEDSNRIHSRIFPKIDNLGMNVFNVSSFIYYDILRPIGILIGEDVLSARLGVSKDSPDWPLLLDHLKVCIYTGVFSDYHTRWWMDEVNRWWNESISTEAPLRRLNAEERVDLLKSKLNLENLTPLTKSKYSVSSNFWTICKHSQEPLDPFDGIELLKEYLPWQDKEYISIDSALEKMDEYKSFVSDIDKKAIRDIVKKERADG